MENAHHVRVHVSRSLVAAAAVLVALTGAPACGSSGAATSSGAPRSASTTKPAHDLRIDSELEAYVTDEWNKAFADPVDANYRPGVTVDTVHCVKVPDTTKSFCTVQPSEGDANRFGYLVSADGTSTERTDGGG